MWLKLFFLLLYFLVLFVLARFFEAIVWYETGFFATQLVDPVALSFKKLKTILECRGLGYSGLPEKKDVRELVEKSGDLMEGELYSALKEEEASESVSSTNFSGEMHFYELVEDTKDGIWLVQVIANDRSPLVGKVHWEKMVKKVSRFGIRTGTFNCSSDPSQLESREAFSCRTSLQNLLAEWLCTLFFKAAEKQTTILLTSLCYCLTKL
ncbi:E3 ubiquitin-protein ligase RNF103 isoform X7 [Lepidochelys kempii]|uniref:E3 ubiquitin-protein ligase RNF103 isoform X7 n=1 Tax=Lepidochelys kempii TaxID=8472 RepID=UPI003C6F255B